MENVDKYLEQVHEGYLNPLDAYIELFKLKKTVEAALENIKPQSINEAQKMGKNFEYKGVKIQIKNAAGRWNFEHLPEWNEAKNNLKAIEEQAKEAYKAAEKGIMLTTPDGVLLTPAEYTNGTETIAITF